MRFSCINNDCLQVIHSVVILSSCGLFSYPVLCYVVVEFCRWLGLLGIVLDAGSLLDIPGYLYQPPGSLFLIPVPRIPIQVPRIHIPVPRIPKAVPRIPIYQSLGTPYLASRTRHFLQGGEGKNTSGIGFRLSKNVHHVTCRIIILPYVRGHTIKNQICLYSYS